jgi:hypothetical protein
MSMADPMMQQAMMAEMGGGAPGGPGGPGAGPSDQELLMLILQLISSGQLAGPGVEVLAQATGAGAPMGGAPGGAPMPAGGPAGGSPMGGAPMAPPMY